MFRLAGFLLKVVPAIYYVIEMIMFVSKSYVSIESQWIKSAIVYGIPFAIFISVILYFTILKDAYDRQLSKEQDENESTLFTVKIQFRRMIRKYTIPSILGVFAAVGFFFYKPNIIAVSIKVGVIFICFLAGESCRIVDIGFKERKRINKQLNS